MDEKEVILVLCDREEEYAQLMTEYLKKHRDLPWQVHTYTDTEQLIKQEEHGGIAMLVVAESAYSEELKILCPQCIVILNESGVIRWEDLPNVNKYQQADGVLKELLEIYVDKADRELPRLGITSGTKLIGVYSPVRRCMQSTFALTLSQMLAQEHSALYLNFEHYVGITELLPDMQSRDMADLLYFLNADKDKFRMRLQTMLQHKGSLDYIPPMRVGQNLLSVTAAEWQNLLQKISGLGMYDYVILDLSESVQGLFDILRLCVRVFTLTKEDKISKSKLLQYEQVLELCSYEDVLEKTSRCSMSGIRRLPDGLEHYTRGDLAEYVKKEIKEI